MKKVLVTGGAGFVGSHICDALLHAEHIVDVLDNFSSGVNFIPQGVRYSFADCGQLREKYDYVVHAAAAADISLNWHEIQGHHQRDWIKRTNIDLTVDLLETIRATPVVFISTCAVYGDGACGTQEDMAQEGTSPYAASKLAGEAYVQAYAYRWGVTWHVLRLGCVVGSRYHHGHIADFVRMAKAGTMRPKSNGVGHKSYVHVKDVADCVVGAVGRHLLGDIYNCVGDLWRAADTWQMMGSPPCEWPANFEGWTGDPFGEVSNEKLCAEGFEPRAISDGVREALNWLGWVQ